MKNTRHHAGRSDLVGEHRSGDAGQLVLLIIFLTVWIMDSFVLEYSTFLAREISWYFRIIPGTIILAVSAYFSFSGLKKVFTEVRETPEILKDGVFSVVRHPIYLGCILVYLGWTVMTLSLISAGVLVFIIVFYRYISRHEEKLLLEHFGKEYEDYCEKVPMLFPLGPFH